MKIAFRVDANHFSGFGHFSRCLNLFRTWAKTDVLTESKFIGNFEDFSLQVLNNYQIPYELVACGDYSSLYETKLGSFDAVVFDSYAITQQTLDLIGQQKFKSILIADESMFDYSGIDVVINFRFDAEKYYHYNSRHQFLGKDFFVVKPEIVALRKERIADVPRPIQKVMIFLGGSFNDVDFVSAIVRKVNAVLPQVQVLLISKGELPSGCNYQHVKPTFDIENILRQSDVVINGGGIIKYEASFALIPTASFSTTLLQYEDSKILASYDIHDDLGYLNSSRHSILENIGVFLTDDGLRAALRKSGTSNYLDDPTQNLIGQLNKLLL